MSGEHDPTTLLASMEPVLDPETYVFCTAPEVPQVPALMIFQEAEGWTFILPKKLAAEEGIEGEFECQRITLNIHSALEAVGFLAKIIPALAAEGMGVNPVAGFYHDHLFVPADRGEDALAALLKLSEEASLK